MSEAATASSPAASRATRPVAAGLDEAAIRMLLVENPARALQVRGAIPAR